ncbi:hypothetical protein BHE74_00030269 [Ensete ventricosum]|nr:hypothetical protein BHE74_00030269 [Ensete ventricosum]
MLRCRPDLVPAEYANSPTSIGIRIFDSSWNRLSEVSTLASVRPSACLLRSAPESWVLHKGLAGGGDFILAGEVIRTFGLIPAVIPGMAESYDEPVGAVVWGEDGAPCSINDTWRSRVAQRPDPSTSDVDVATDLAT